VKVGSSTITSSAGRINPDQLQALVEQLAELRKRGYEVILVSSGAIAAGVEQLGLPGRPTSIPELQAAASVGQGLLIQNYANLFKKHGLKVGQVLLTQHDTTHRQQYLNARNTLHKLLDLGVIPVINENDTTAVDEIKFGDNDTLAALVASLIEADLLIILTDTDGLFTTDPRLGGEARLISEVQEITPEIEAIAGGVGTDLASGGMLTKIQAAKVATFARVGTVIVNGRTPDILLQAAEGKEVGTFFAPREKGIDSRRRWIAFGRLSRGRIVVDQGAKDALCDRGKSLLPAGVVSCEGNFEFGDAVDIVGSDGQAFARGLTNYGCAELKKIMGLRSDEIGRVMGEGYSEEVVHRDCMVILT
jgi:glutamate 5-kinase